jgi:hypothetical protein
LVFFTKENLATLRQTENMLDHIRVPDAFGKKSHKMKPKSYFVKFKIRTFNVKKYPESRLCVPSSLNFQSIKTVQLSGENSANLVTLSLVTEIAF